MEKKAEKKPVNRKPFLMCITVVASVYIYLTLPTLTGIIPSFEGLFLFEAVAFLEYLMARMLFRKDGDRGKDEARNGGLVRIVDVMIIILLASVTAAIPQAILAFFAAACLLIVAAAGKLVFRFSRWKELLGVAGLGFLCLACCYVSMLATDYYNCFQEHELVMKDMRRIALYLDEMKQESKDGCYPEQVKFDTADLGAREVIRPGGVTGGHVRYFPTADRKQFRLVFEGNLFTENSPYVLEPGYPQYSSEFGVTTPGNRTPFVISLYRKIVSGNLSSSGF